MFGICTELLGPNQVLGAWRWLRDKWDLEDILGEKQLDSVKSDDESQGLGKGRGQNLGPHIKVENEHEAAFETMFDDEGSKMAEEEDWYEDIDGEEYETDATYDIAEKQIVYEAKKHHRRKREMKT